MKLTKRIICAILVVFAICIGCSNVNMNAATMKLNKKSMTLEVGKTFKLKMNSTNQKVTWSSTKKSVAKVNSDGKVTAVKAGTATIKAKVHNKSYSCKVKVVNANANATNITLGTADNGDFLLNISSIKLSFILDNNSTEVKVSVLNALDNIVYTQKISKVNKNSKTTLTWNGKDSNGNNVQEGTYYFQIKAGNLTTTTNYFVVYANSEFSGGNGSKENPYLISNATDFANISKHNGKHFKQTASIDFNYSTVQPMFTKDSPFTGTYDGNGMSLSNYLSKDAIFLYVGNTGELRNISIINGSVNYSSIDDGYGLALLSNKNYGNIINCKVNGSVIGSDDVALLVGYNYGKISNCTSSGTATAIYGEATAAGLVAWNYAEGKIIDCSSNAHVIGKTNGWYAACAGGLVGGNYGFIISCKCSSTIEVSVKYGEECIGGIACTNNGTIMNSSYNGPTKCNYTYNGSGILQ